jgi:hypothetical protein
MSFATGENYVDSLNSPGWQARWKSGKSLSCLTSYGKKFKADISQYDLEK